MNFELVHQLHVCEDAECPRLSLGNSRKPPALPYNDIAFLRPADLKGEVHFKMAGYFPFHQQKDHTMVGYSPKFQPLKSFSTL